MVCACAGTRSESTRTPARAPNDLAIPPPPAPGELSPLPKDCNVRLASDTCFRTFTEACWALACAAPLRCGVGASFVPVVSCVPPDEAVRE
jgi:hypothetical protein